MHPLKAAKEAEKLTWEEVASRVNALRLRRRNGRLLRVTGLYLSQIASNYRNASRLVAEAVSQAFGGKVTPGAVLFGKDESKQGDAA